MSEKPPPGRFRLLYFASAASFTRKSMDDLPAPMPLSSLFTLLEEKYNGITKSVLSSSAVTINLEYVDIDEHPDISDSCNKPSASVINEGDEVAIIPPVSSG